MARHKSTGDCVECLRRAFTLLELLVVLSIIAVLLGLTIPAVVRVRDASQRAACASNLRQLGLAVHQYASDRRRLPKGCDYPYLTQPEQVAGQVGVSWHTSILPYVEQDGLWNLAFEAQRLDPVGNASVHETVMAHKVGLFLCPTVTMESGGYGNGITWGLTSYLGVAGTNVHANDGVFHRNYTVRFADITDGTSNTLMIGERPPGPQGIFSGWYAAWGDSVCLLAQILPAGSNEWLPIQAISCEVTIGTFRPGQVDDACDINHFWSTHRGGANFAFADGSVHFLTYGNSDLMAALATRAGGEAVQPLD